MKKRDSKQNKEMEKMKLKLQAAEEQGGTPMHSVGTKEGKITKMNDLTGQTLAGVTIVELTSFSSQRERKQMKDLIAAVMERFFIVYCRKDIFPKSKFATDDWSKKSLHTDYVRKKMTLGNVT